jgi:hypothetical protein
MKRVERVDPAQIVRPKFQEVCIDGRVQRVECGSLDVAGADRVIVELDFDIIPGHGVLRVHIDGRTILRVTHSGRIMVDDHRLRWGDASGGTYRVGGVPRGDPPALRGGAYHAARKRVVAELEAELAPLCNGCT